MTDVLGCAFCDIIWRGARSDIVGSYESDRVIIIRPLNPCVPEHLLIIPRNHVEDFIDGPAESAACVRAAAAWANPGRAYNLLTSAGAEATQTVYHLHYHLIPRRRGDGIMLPWGINA